MELNPNVVTKDQFIGAVLTGDYVTRGKLLHPAFELRQSLWLPYGGNYCGVAGFEQFLANLNDTFDVIRLDEMGVYFGGHPEKMIIEFDFEGRHLATGMVHKTSTLEMWHFSGGLIRMIKPHYYDAAPVPLTLH